MGGIPAVLPTYMYLSGSSPILSWFVLGLRQEREEEEKKAIVSVAPNHGRGRECLEPGREIGLHANMSQFPSVETTFLSTHTKEKKKRACHLSEWPAFGLLVTVHDSSLGDRNPQLEEDGGRHPLPAAQAINSNRPVKLVLRWERQCVTC